MRTQKGERKEARREAFGTVSIGFAQMFVVVQVPGLFSVPKVFQLVRVAGSWRFRERVF